MIEEETSRHTVRPLYRGVCVFFALAGIVAIAVSFMEEPRPWKFWISGTVFVLVFGYLGVTGKTPKWMHEQKK